MSMRLTRPLSSNKMMAANPTQISQSTTDKSTPLFDLVQAPMPEILCGQDFCLEALQGEIDTTLQMKQAKTKKAYTEATEKWKIYRSLLNRMLRMGVNPEDKNGFPIINRAISARATSLTNYLRQVIGFPIESSGGVAFWQIVLLREIQNNKAATSSNLLIKALKKPGMDINAPLDEQGNKALPLAVKCRNYNRVKELLKTPGIQVDEADDEGKTPLYWALERDRPDLVQELTGQGADPNHPDKLGHSPLHVAANLPNPAYTKMLLEKCKGANPNVTDKDGNTPLHFTAWRGSMAIAEALLKKGADPDKENHTGESPAVLADAAEHPAMVELIKSYSPKFPKRTLQPA